MKEKAKQLLSDRVVDYRYSVDAVALGTIVEVLLEIKEQNAELIKEIKAIKEEIKPKEVIVEKEKVSTTKK